MIVHPAADPGPRTVALPRVTRAVAGLLLALLVAACGSTTGPSGAPSTSSAPSGGPVSSGGPAAGSPGPGASQPRWPGTTVLAVIALGIADAEIQKAGVDLQAAADSQDLKAMWGAADGLARLIDELIPKIGRLELDPATQGAAALYHVAFPELSAGAKQLRDSITSGDASGVVAGSQAIAKGLADYAPVREVLGGLVEQAILQQRNLTQ